MDTHTGPKRPPNLHAPTNQNSNTPADPYATAYASTSTNPDANVGRVLRYGLGQAVPGYDPDPVERFRHGHE